MRADLRNAHPNMRQLSALLDEYARRIERLVPSARNPMLFHENKSEIAAGLSRLADDLRAAPGSFHGSFGCGGGVARNFGLQSKIAR